MAMLSNIDPVDVLFLVGFTTVLCLFGLCLKGLEKWMSS